MEEKYIGPKFKTILEKKSIPYNERVKELIVWYRKFNELGLTPRHTAGSLGNLSFRSGDGFIITAAGKGMGEIVINDLVKVKTCDVSRNEIEAVGLVGPSSESFLHWFIYRSRKDVNAIFHGHSKVILEIADELNLIKTMREKPYGSIGLAEEVLKVLNKNNYIVIKNHGFLSLGKSIKEAGNLAIKIYKIALQKL